MNHAPPPARFGCVLSVNVLQSSSEWTSECVCVCVFEDCAAPVCSTGFKQDTSEESEEGWGVQGRGGGSSVHKAITEAPRPVCVCRARSLDNVTRLLEIHTLIRPTVTHTYTHAHTTGCCDQTGGGTQEPGTARKTQEGTWDCNMWPDATFFFFFSNMYMCMFILSYSYFC